MPTVQCASLGCRSGHMNGILPQTWDALAQHPVLLKGPMTTPQGGGYKSIDVTLRKTLGLFANVRPCVAYHPYVDALHPGMDVVIVCENDGATWLPFKQLADVKTTHGNYRSKEVIWQSDNPVHRLCAERHAP